MLALKLANDGWWGGVPGAILAAPADEVMIVVQYVKFKDDYEAESMKIAKADAK